MKLFKRSICLILIAAAILSLCTVAYAVSASVSTQALKIDGKAYTPAAYNIGGSNYFKLRDLAYLLNGSKAQFSVGYDSKTNAVTINTGKAYTADGKELASVGSGKKDASSSKQTIYVDGKKNTSLTVYNIGGNNFFKLRDLGDALGFGVDYDSASRTMLITTAAQDWAPDISFTTVDMNGNTWTDACFKDYKLTVINYWAYWCGPCVGEMPDLQKLSQDYASKGVQLLGLYDEIEEKQDAAMVKKLGVTYPCLRYTSGFEYLNVGSLPATVFVDGNGKILGKLYLGSRSYDKWASVIDMLLS